MKLSKYFTLEEATISQQAERLGIDNTPSDKVIVTISKVALELEKIRFILTSKPLVISSWYRSRRVNTAVGGSTESQHMLGEAVDFICPRFGTPAEICLAIVRSDVPFDQLILEHTWVHISFKTIPNAKNRNQVLSLLNNKSYITGLTDKFGRSL